MKIKLKNILPAVGFGFVFLLGAQSVSALTLNEVAKLLPSDGDAFDRFGGSVAVSGNMAVIGAYSDKNDNGSSPGSAYLFVRSSGVWSQQAKLLPSDRAAGDIFGWSVAVSGNTAVIGDYLDDDNGTNSGSAYVFDLTGASGTMNEHAKLLPSDGDASDTFGLSVAVSGNTAVIGAKDDEDNGNRSGSAYVFDLTGARGTVNEDAKLLPSDGAAFDFFGWSVAVSGNMAVIGAPSFTGNGVSGSAYVFDLTGASGTVNEDAKLVPSDGAADVEFGWSVAVSGNTAVIGARFDDDNGSESGSAYVFDLIVDDDGDADGDGVSDSDDFCEQTVIPEGVPTVQLRPNRWALIDGDSVFDTVLKGKGNGPNRSYTIEDTAGCSCEQIIEALGLGNGHRYHGCSIGAMDDWVERVTP